jgi:hypothetical protein
MYVGLIFVGSYDYITLLGGQGKLCGLGSGGLNRYEADGGKLRAGDLPAR